MAGVVGGGGGLASGILFSGAETSAFGTLEVGDLTPVVQMDFVYGINTQTGVSAVSGTGATVDTNASRLRLQSGTNNAGSAQFNSRKIARYRAGQGCTARFTGVFATGTASNTQIVGVGSTANGYFFGYNGTVFGILHRNNSVDTWIAQTAWNGDKCDGTGQSNFVWSPQFGNVMMVKYPYLGFGAIRFYVQNPKDGNWIQCHVIQYPNTTITTQASNPSLVFYAQNLNSGNTTNLTMYVGSVGIFISGQRSFASNPAWSASNQATNVIHDIDTNMVTLKNCTTYNGQQNRVVMRITALSFGTIPASGVTGLYVRLNATIGGVPVFNTVNGVTADNGVTITSGNSVASVDVAGTTVTGGLQLFVMMGSNPVNLVFDLTPYDILLIPGDRLTFSLLTSNTSNPAAVAVNWQEDGS